MRNLILEVYERALKTIENIYQESMYGINDLYRIPDICHSLDDKQWKSKYWLAEELYKLLSENDEHGRIYVAGGWYGLMAEILSKKFPRPRNYIISADIDPMAQFYGEKLWPNRDFGFITENSLEIFPPESELAWITTSGEHFDPDDLNVIIKSKPSFDTWVVVQSNNFLKHQSHINCYENLDLFCQSLDLTWIAYAGELDLGDFKRFMVIGK